MLATSLVTFVREKWRISFISLKMNGMPKMLCMVVMGTTLMGIVCGWNLLEVAEDTLHPNAIAVTVGAVIGVDHPSIPTIELLSLGCLHLLLGKTLRITCDEPVRFVFQMSSRIAVMVA